MDETKIHTGTRIKLKQISRDEIPAAFVQQITEFAHNESRILAVFLFGLQQGDDEIQPSMVIAIKTGLFSSGHEAFLNIVDEVQLRLPEDLALNLYRFDSSEVLARYCANSVEPLYLRTTGWLDKQKKKYPA